MAPLEDGTVSETRAAMYNSQPGVNVSRSDAEQEARGVATNGDGLPLWQSNPRSTNVIFLDFDGGSYAGTRNLAGADPGNNGDRFSASERVDVIRAAMEVAEGYALFDVNVTTDDRVRRNADQWAWIVITDDEGSSGRAKINSFGRPNRGQGYAGSDAVFNPPSSQRGYLLIHEVGHMFGLHHCGRIHDGQWLEWEELPSRVTGSTGAWMGGRNSRFDRYEWMKNYPEGSNRLQDPIKLIGRQLGFAGRPPDGDSSRSCDGRCSSSCPCDLGEGDCDRNSDCLGDLVCPADGPGPEFCEERTRESCHRVSLYHSDYCTSSCPCSEGEGDCDRDSQCAPGLRCRHNVGAAYGLAPRVDVCER
jgi:hypothetical protein